MTTKLFEEITGASTIAGQLGILRPAFRDWKADTASADESQFNRLTRMLTGIYAFGLMALDDKDALRKEGKTCQIAFPGDTSDKNWWLPVIKMATGDFHPTKTIERTDPKDKKAKVQVQEFVPGLSLVRYAVALRALEAEGVAVEDVEAHVRAAEYKSGTVTLRMWNGIIAADRASRIASGASKSRKMQDQGKLAQAAENLLTEPHVPAEVRNRASASKADFCLMWGYLSEGVFVPGKRVEGDIWDAKARTFAEAYALDSEKTEARHIIWTEAD